MRDDSDDTYSITREHLIQQVRSALDEVEREDRDIFCDLARNRPGAGGTIKVPRSNGFLDLDELFGCDDARTPLLDHLDAVPSFRSRRSMFEDFISIVHRAAPNFHVYLGRTFLREGREQAGPQQRFQFHWSNRGMTYGRVLARVPRESILRDEELAISLVKFWDRIGALCCNNTVMLATGTLSKDPMQLIYMCLRERTAKEKREYQRGRKIVVRDLT